MRQAGDRYVSYRLQPAFLPIHLPLNGTELMEQIKVFIAVAFRPAFSLAARRLLSTTPPTS